MLEAAHIRPWKDGGRHEVPNGLPLRRDIHRLLDLGFVTVRLVVYYDAAPAPGRGSALSRYLPMHVSPRRLARRARP